MDQNQLLAKFSSDFCLSSWNKLKKFGLEGVGITGSYARGDYSKSRPDINFALFIKEQNYRLLLGLGEIVTRLNQKYSRYINFRPRYLPERFIPAWSKDPRKTDLFFKLAFFTKKEKDFPMPFGRPKVIVEGHQISIKNFFGENYLENLKLNITNEEIIKGVEYVLPRWFSQFKLIPLSYNLENSLDELFDESFEWGKMAILNYCWAHAISNGLDCSRKENRMKVFEIVHNKSTVGEFFKLPKKEKGLIDFIFSVRINYNRWKNDKKIAYKTFSATYQLFEYFIKELHR